MNFQTGLARPDKIKSIAVFRALQLGDMLCVVPALRALRASFPGTRITLIGLPWAASFAKRFHRYIDDFVGFPGHRAFPERTPDMDALPAFYEAMRRRKFDLALQLHGSGPIANAIVEKLGARLTAGFTIDPSDHNRGHYVPWPETGHEIRRFLSLIESLGLPLDGQHLEFPVTAADGAEAEALMRRHRIRIGRYICLHAGARLRSRRWPPERFADVADALARHGYQIVLTGSSDEIHLTKLVRDFMSFPAVDISGQSSLGATAAILRSARLLVCNDTGVSHIAAAVGVPSVVITMGSDPARWAPLDNARHATVVQPVSCRPCAFELCPIGHPCALAITPAMVIDAARRQLMPAKHRNGRMECVPCES